MTSNKKLPLIIAISGTHGVGKTTLAHALAIKLDIKQRIGLGVVLKTMQILESGNEEIQKWDDYSGCKTEQDFVKKIHAQCRIMGSIISKIVDKAIKTCEPYIIDGIQLLPQYLPMSKIKLVALFLNDKDEHKKRYTKPNVTKTRHAVKNNFETVKDIEKEILKNIRKYKIPLFESSIGPNLLADLIIKKLKFHRV